MQHGSKLTIQDHGSQQKGLGKGTLASRRPVSMESDQYFSHVWQMTLKMEPPPG